MSTPKGEYIPINSIEDIDPLNITIRDLNKRYIDRQGNRYATRFNLQSRKVEIVQIVKGMHEAKRIQQQKMMDRTHESGAPARAEAASDDDDEPMEDYESDSPPSSGESFDEPVDTSSAAEDFDPDSVAPFIEQQFIEEVEADFERIKQRQQGVINNLKNSGAFTGDLDDKLANVVREMETDSWGKCEAAINYSKELKSYPRPVSYYVTKLTPEQKSKVEAQTEDHRKIELIRRWELQRSFDEAYNAVQKAGKNALSLLNEISAEARETLPALQKQNLDDAGTSLDFMLGEIAEKLKKIQHWRHRYGS